jgi:hypothetical protein
MKASEQDPATLRACSRALAKEAANWRAVAGRVDCLPEDARRYSAIAVRLETYAGEFTLRATRNEKRRKRATKGGHDG